MAGMEQIVVHSKSYIVRWIQVDELHSISWSVQPHKKSINFGIFKHPGTKNGLTPILPTHETVETAPSVPGTPAVEGVPYLGKRGRQGSVGKNEDSRVVEKLEGIGMKCVDWTGRCDAERVSLGRFDVKFNEGGMYGLVFDNTFSKQTSKTVHFVLLTHPTNAPPKSGHHLHYSQAFATGSSSSSIGKSYSPSLLPVTDSNESLPAHHGVFDDPRPASGHGQGVESRSVEGASFYTGALNKKRRKKGQGYAKRFFSLDFTSSTLSYYRNRHSSALRGAVPLSLAAVGVNEKTKEFSVDSGAEVWHLKALNKKDFEGWRNALERASLDAALSFAPAASSKPRDERSKLVVPNPSEDREWECIEQLVSQVSGTRDAVRALAKDTDPKYLASGASLTLVHSAPGSNAQTSSGYEAANSYFPEVEESSRQRRPFWKRAPSGDRSPAALTRRSVSAQLAVPTISSGSTLPPSPRNASVPKRHPPRRQASFPIEDVHERCMALLRDLDSVVSDFAGLVAESKARRFTSLVATRSRASLDSTNQEFFDAEDGGDTPARLSRVLMNIRREEEDEEAHEQPIDADSDTSSDAGDGLGESSLLASPKTAHHGNFPSRPSALPPLPLPPVQRRSTLLPPQQLPPSIIGFLRKNAGKDLSTVSMPVTANEPISLLQHLAESMEYSQLLDSAASIETTPAERLMYVTAFAVSYFSNYRVKERAMRKPFNPMLGETFELVREDRGWRFVAEKISHHPLRMACQADSLTNGGWSFTQSPRPAQKFWGKSVELNTEGRARVVLHASGEHYSWNQATCFLRNVIAGEKYVEPVQSMAVLCESNAMHAVATFKAGGMFSGRSEDVSVQLFDPAVGDAPLPLALMGKWTEGLKRSDTGAEIWTVGSLVPDAPKVYGFTTFAASLNEITDVESEHLPPTDSRLRPDQGALERGDADGAEGLKAHLEERQRSRRKVLEAHGQTWTPQFFEMVTRGDDDDATAPKGLGGEEIWVLKQQDGYWEKRANGDWSGVQEVFEI